MHRGWRITDGGEGSILNILKTSTGAAVSSSSWHDSARKSVEETTSPLTVDRLQPLCCRMNLRTPEMVATISRQ